MAICLCKECGKEVSNKAITCPNCGIMKPARQAWNKKTIIAGICIGLASFAWLRNSVNPNENESILHKLATKQQPLAITAKQLLRDYKENEARADQRYKGKMLKLTGSIDSIKKDLFDNPVVYLQTDNMFENVMVALSKDDNALAANLNKGDNVEFNCVGDSMILGTPSCRMDR